MQFRQTILNEWVISNHYLLPILGDYYQAKILVIDYLNVSYEENQFEKKTEKNIDDHHFIVTKWHDATHFYKQIQVINNVGELPINLSTERVAKFSLNDFKEMLSLQNMQIEEVFGGYDLNKYIEEKSVRMIILARKISY